MAETCETCTHRDSDGLCRWADGMPPVLVQIFSALHAEPATHIDWENLQNGLFPVEDRDWCNQYEKGGEDD